MKMDSITLEEAAAIAKPYDEHTYSREQFAQLVKQHPKLEEEFQEKFTDELKLAAEEKGLYFIINPRKSNKVAYKKHIKLRVGFCGPERVTTISIDC